MLLITPFNQSPIDFWVTKNEFSILEMSKIEQDLSLLPFQDAEVGKKGGESHKDKEIRRGQVKWIPQSPEWHWVYKKINDCVIDANNQVYNFNISHIAEQIQYCEYSSTLKDYYGWHLDIGNQFHSLRKLSVIIQLSDSKEYEGGDIELFTGGEYEKDNFTMNKEKGSILIFPSYILHRVKPVTRGIRKSLVLWVGGNQFR
jgi:PKHD-type hydroxylase